MSFQVTARTILQLGAELISSDEIAFYELVKNAIDAKSPNVEIEIVSRLPYDIYVSLREKLASYKTYLDRKAQKKNLHKSNVELGVLKDIIETNLYTDAPYTLEFRQQLQSVDSFEELLQIVDEANYINIRDFGDGMSLDDLREVYLTIGTRSRLKQRQSGSNGDKENGERPLLGEKGVGRLSTMRLGNRLYVTTTKFGETNWNELQIDWGRFSHDSDELLGDITFSPEIGEQKDSKSEKGTLIHISALTSEWTLEKVRRLTDEEFSRFADPFNPEAKYPIDLYFNDQWFEIPDFDRAIFKHAHATVEAEFIVEDINEADDLDAVRLKGKINYRYRELKKNFNLNAIEVKSAADVKSLSPLKSLGPFSMKAYWFNRQLLTAAAGVPNFQYIRKVVKQWAGGLMLYRDGFRVYPYGNPETDDWLDLDQKALASSGYKVNRRQIIGKVNITSQDNPRLIDQTNREGLRDCIEKGILIRILKHILEGEMRVFLNNVEKKIYEEKNLNLGIINKRFNEEVKAALRNVHALVKKLPDPKKEVRTISNINEAFKKIQQFMKDTKEIAESYKQGHEETVHLAGVGLMVEMLAHELNRATANALATLSDVKNEDLPYEVSSQFKSLEAQMKTLKKRLQVLEPVSTAGRQRKETFELVAWVKNILAGHKPQFDRHGIKYSVKVIPTNATWQVKAVKGMIVQVLDNLISNSVYWLKQQKDISTGKISTTKRVLNATGETKIVPVFISIPDRALTPRIDVVIDVDNKDIEFTDNGPGIDPELTEEIFQPFVSFKPSGQGKGLGLYISREIATYHDAELYLSETPTVHSNRLNTFILSFRTLQQ